MWLLCLEWPIWLLSVGTCSLPRSCLIDVEAVFLIAMFFIAFAFQKWQHEIYPSCKQIGISEIDKACTQVSGFCEHGLCLSDEELAVARVCEGPGEGPPVIAGSQDPLDRVAKVAA